MHIAQPEEKFQVGVLFTDANPKDKYELHLELVTALDVIAKYALDQVVYVVNDGRYIDTRLEASRKQRWELAKKTCEKYEPLISISDIGIIDKEPETVVMANGQSRLRVDPEDLAFRLFQLNSDEHLKLVFITTAEHCRRRNTEGDDDTINKLLSNIKDRLHDFDPSVHQVTAVFIGSLTDVPQSLTFDADEQALLSSGTFCIEFMAPEGTMPRCLGGQPRGVVKKDAIPFKAFCGYLKQHAHDDLSELEQKLFDLLFPAFQGTDDNDKAFASYSAAFEKWKQDPEKAAQLSNILPPLPQERRQRRFSGYGLPRSRYFSVCVDSEGADFQTLAHELRAYRDPVDIGMVEVLDLAGGAVLENRQETFRLDSEQAIAVLIHHPELLPAALKKLNFQRLPGLQEDREIFLYRFPYRVIPCTIERTVDLRWPEARDWFYHRFREPTELSAAGPFEGEDTPSPTIAHSRFHLENGKPTAPRNFWEMLPTLTNPDLGGGPESDVGSTMFMIGNWMRQNDIDALIFPSARCDCTAVLEDDEPTHWEGWNLVDYRDAPLPLKTPLQEIPNLVITLTLSPWCWKNFVSGAKLGVVEDSSKLRGSFKISGVIGYWAKDYKSQIRALDIARIRHGQEPRRSLRSDGQDGLAARSFEIGALTFYWLRQLVEGAQPDVIDECVLELQGLAIPYRMYPLTGRISELANEIKRDPQEFNSAWEGSLQTVDRIENFFQSKYPGRDLHTLSRLGADHEMLLLMFSLECKKNAADESKQYTGITQIASLARENLTNLRLEKTLRHEIMGFYDSVLCLKDKDLSDKINLLTQGIHLQQRIRKHLREQP